MPKTIKSKGLGTPSSGCGAGEQAGGLLQNAVSFLINNPEEALHYAVRAEQIAKKNNQPYELAMARKIAGNVHFNRNEINQAHNYYLSALKPALDSGDIKLQGDLHFNLGRTFTRLRNHSSALEYLLKSLEYREKLQDRKDETASLNHIGQVYWEMKDYAKAVLYFSSAAELADAEEQPALASVVFNNLGNALLKTGKTDKALEAYLISLRCKEKLGNETSLATAYISLGNLYFTCGEFARAEEYYIKAMHMYEKSGNRRMAATSYSNLGSTYNELGSDKLALQYHRKALRAFSAEVLPEEESKALNNIGNVNLKRKDYTSALKYFRQALQIKLEKGDDESLGIAYNNIGTVYCLMDKLKEAADNLRLSVEYGEKAGSAKLLLENYSRLGDVCAALGDFENAFEYLSKYREKDLEYYSEESRNKLTETMVRFDVELKSNEISQLTELQRVQKELLDSQIKDKLRYLNLYRAKQKEMKKREQAQKKLQELNRDLEKRIGKALEEYKVQQELIIQKSKLESLGVLAAGIAHEIYQPLSAISISINNMRNKAQKNELSGEYLNKKINRISEDIQRIRQVIEHVRLFSREQKETQLERVDVHQTLQDALGLLAYDLNKKGIKTKLILADQPIITVGNRFKLEQVFLNLLANARDAVMEKAESSSGLVPQIEIRTHSKSGTAEIDLTDNGTGMSNEVREKMFDPFFTTKNPEKGTGLGLSISYGIIKEMDGSVEALSEPGSFTRITVKLPDLQEKT
jgi:two-component system, NtrC family, sensor kinase